MKKLAYGVGISDGKTSEKVNGKQVFYKSYVCWRNMLTRCYCPKYQSKNKTYHGCSVCKEWLTYSNFKSFYDAYYIEGWCLDKDMYVLGSKVYSPITALFVPQQLNKLFTDRGALRGKFPIGVSLKSGRGKYHAQCQVNGKTKHIGDYTTQDAASKAYQEFKHGYVAGEIDTYRNIYSDNKPLMDLLNELEKRNK